MAPSLALDLSLDLIDGRAGGSPPVSSFLLLSDGASRLLLSDGASKLVL